MTEEEIDLESLEEDTKGYLSFFEHPIFSIADVAREAGYEIANTNGTPCSGPINYSSMHDIISILKSSLGKPSIIANIYVNDEKRGAEYDNIWIVEIYGRENIQPIARMLMPIREKCEGGIIMKLEDEVERTLA